MNNSKLPECRECGKTFERRRAGALFCSVECRGHFNRRRRDRGTEIYDFVMAKFCGVPHLGDTIQALLSAYHDADLERRAGRLSYQPIEQARMNLPITYSKQGDKR